MCKNLNCYHLFIIPGTFFQDYVCRSDAMMFVSSLRAYTSLPKMGLLTRYTLLCKTARQTKVKFLFDCLTLIQDAKLKKKVTVCILPELIAKCL